MPYARRTQALAGLFLLTLALPAAGGEYRDPTGFSFTYPNGWSVVTKPGQGAKEALPPEVRSWVARNNLDLNRVSVALIRNGREEFLENLNVVVDRQQIPVNEATVKKLLDILPRQYQSMGATVTGLEGRVRRVGTREAVVMEYEARLPGVPFRVKQMQVAFPGGGNTYIVTCSAKVNTFANHAPTFDTILASFQMPAPVAQGFAWSKSLNGAVLGGVIGGVVGGLAMLGKKLLGK